jgi:hypothetical protein
MEAASTSETSVKFCQSTRRNIPEENHLYTHRHEKFKSYKKSTVYFFLFQFPVTSSLVRSKYSTQHFVENYNYKRKTETTGMSAENLAEIPTSRCLFWQPWKMKQVNSLCDSK